MGEAPRIVLLHGFTNTGACWRRVLDAGVSAQTPDIRAATLTEALSDLAATATPRFTLGGYSQGGRIALHAALDPRLGQRIQRLVLIGASPGIADPAERERRRRADERLAEEIETETVERFAARWAQTPVLAGLADDLAREAHADRLRNTPDGLAATLRGLGTGALASLWERLGELQIPVDLIAGARDAKFSAIAEDMARRIPDARVHIVPGAGHQVHLEAPAAVAAVLQCRSPQYQPARS